MRTFLAEGGAKKPWYQMMVELGVAEDQGYFIHPADVNRLVVRSLFAAGFRPVSFLSLESAPLTPTFVKPLSFCHTISQLV